jgi:GH25 family lysozyme M1 (1,4-beta-N-acetylmuramidase)
MSAQGEDRSGYQAVGPWAGSSFGFTKATEGTTYADPTFAANWARLRAEGKARGAYCFFRPGLDPAAQARFFVATVKKAGLRPGDMLVGDIETLAGAAAAAVAPASPPRRAHLEVAGALTAGATLGGEAKRFLDEVTALAGPHCPVLLYTNLSVAAHLGACTGYGLWIAHPGTVAPVDVSPWKTWRYWQWSFGGGRGGGDRDAYNGTRADMERWLGTYKRTARHPRPMPWAADGTTTLAALAAAHGTAVSTIIRLSCEHGRTKPEFTADVAGWLDTALSGSVPPAGTVLMVPGGSTP